MASNRDDPVGAFNFLISFINSNSTSKSISIASGISLSIQPGGVVAGFSECSGLEASIQTEDYQEGGNNRTTLKFPKHIAYTNIRLKRGITRSDDLWNWFNGFIEGNGIRRDGSITLCDEQQNPVKVWQFKRGLPVKWTGPTFNATQSQVAIQELEIAHEGLKLVPSLARIAIDLSHLL
jgi:phage tail-like protein